MQQDDLPPNVLEVLDNIAFPATVIELVAHAQDHDASEQVLDQIQAMPDRVYNSIHDVAMHLGQVEHLAQDDTLWASAPSSDYFGGDERPLNMEHEQR